MKIYSLAHPVTNEIRYIGVTSGNLNTRLAQHKWDAKNKMSYKCHWIKNILDSTNRMPNIELIEETNDVDWIWLEIYWIEQFRQWGFDLVNTDSGGKGVHKDVEGRSRSIEAHKKCIHQYDLDGTFIRTWDSITEACRLLGVSDSRISSKDCKTSCGYRWSLIKVDKLEPIVSKGQSDQYRVTLTHKITGEIIIFSSKVKAEKFLKAHFGTARIYNLGYKIELMHI